MLANPRTHRLVQLAAILLVVTTANAQTCSGIAIRPGPVINQTWQQATYCVQGTVLVDRLTIGPGAIVKLAPGAKILVQTTLTVHGTEAQPALLTAQDPTKPWSGIFYEQTKPGSVLRYAILEHTNRSAVQISNTKVVIANCLFRKCTSQGSGGAVSISMNTGDFTLTDCEIRDCASGSHGGGLYAWMRGNGTLRLNRCRIERCTANPGSKIRGHQVGGGLAVWGNAVIKDSQIARNTCYSKWVVRCVGGYDGRGGGGFFDDGNVELERCIWYGNHLHTDAGDGGCVTYANINGTAFFFGGEKLKMTNCLVSGHSGSGRYSRRSNAIRRHGAIWIDTGELTAVNCTLARNEAVGLRNYKGTAKLDSSIVWYNANSGAQTAGTITVDYSCYQWGHAGTGNSAFNPAFAGLTASPHHLIPLPGSCAIDSANPARVDAKRPPGLGGTRGDAGFTGGPHNQFDAPVVAVCGANRYGVMRGGANRMRLEWASQPQSALGTVHARGASTGPGALLLSLARDEAALGPFTILVGAEGVVFIPIRYDNAGQASLPVNLATLPIGVPIYLQAVSVAEASNGLQLLACIP